MNTGWWAIDIHGCYSLVKIPFAPISACENIRRIWRHNACISRSRDVTDPLWWRHNARSETTVPGDNCEMSDRWLFLAELCVQDIKQRVRNKIIHSLPWIRIFGSLVMRFHILKPYFYLTYFKSQIVYFCQVPCTPPFFRCSLDCLYYNDL